MKSPLSNQCYLLKITSALLLIIATCLFYIMTLSTSFDWKTCEVQPLLCHDREIIVPYTKLEKVLPEYYELTHIGEPLRVFYTGASPTNSTISIIGKHLQGRDFQELQRDEHKRRKWKAYAGFLALFGCLIYGLGALRKQWPIY